MRILSAEISTSGWGREGDTGMAEGLFLRSIMLNGGEGVEKRVLERKSVCLGTAASRMRALSCVSRESDVK